jgi:rfaE bifunctional protein kinase chain/domain
MLHKKYQHKIKSVDELRQLIGPFPREKTVVMCHGVFDVVHPGHLRHLAYAKDKADILIASLTADQHIDKGIYRPHVPQDLRAINLAAFEMIDYVLIDRNAAPLESIKLLQPDFFAKGYEYVANGMMVKTSEEEEHLKSYGGEILFTPGDIVYSSSSLINSNPPAIRYEKLATLMETTKTSFNDLEVALEKMKGLKVHVVGDTIIDGFTQTSMIGGQTKTPTMSVLYESRQDYVGGAGIVAKHLAAAGASVTFTTLLGDDPLKDFALNDLAESNITVNAIIDDKRPTTHKNAIIARNYRLLKIDTLDNTSINTTLLEKFIDTIKKTDCDLIIFSDFRHGIFNKFTIPPLIDAIPDNCVKVADSQVASRWGNITEFKGFDLITPNQREARFALGDQDTGIRPLASELYKAAQCKNLILKLGEKGTLTCSNNDDRALNSFIVLDSFAHRIIDAVGAGDALLAYASLALTNGAGHIIASILGSMAAACECEYDGNIPITISNMRNKLNYAKKHICYQPITDNVQHHEFAEA